MYKNININGCLRFRYMELLKYVCNLKKYNKNSTQVYYKCTKRKFIQLSLNKNTK